MDMTLDIPIVEPSDSTKIIQDGVKALTNALGKGFGEMKGLYDLVSDLKPANKEVKQKGIFTKESIMFYQDMNKGKIPKAKKKEIAMLTNLAKEEAKAMMDFGASIGDELAKPLLPALANVANGFFNFRDGLRSDFASFTKDIKDIGISLVPQGIKDMLGVIKERSDKDDKQDKKESKFWKTSGDYFKKSLKTLGSMLKSMGNWIFDLILFFIALAIFDPNGTFLMSILNMLFNVGMMLLNMFINMIPKIIAMIPPIITKLVEAFVKALPLLIQAFTKIFEGLGGIITMLIDTLAEQLPILIPEIMNAIILLVPKLIDLLVKVLPKLLMLIVDNIGVIINSLVEALPVLIDAIIEALPTIIIAFIDAFIKLVPILAMGLWKVMTILTSRIPKLFGALFKIFKNYFIDPFKKMFIELFKKISDYISGSAIGKAFDKIGQLFKDLKDIGGKIANALNLTSVANKITDMFMELWDWLKGKWPFSMFASDTPAQEDLFSGTGGKDALKNLVEDKVTENSALDQKFDKLAEELAKSGKLKDSTGDKKIDTKDLAEAVKRGDKDVIDAIKSLKQSNSATIIFTANDLKTI